ncbi:NAD(+) diphosphatase [Micromonospora sp. DT31]|uniref:NAD(+) diphosphatase n=1 Tax=Micromonospora sp. DT31 TaxID=3393434 RepID=UPI003CED9BAB
MTGPAGSPPASSPGPPAVGFRPAADHGRPPHVDDVALPVSGRKLLTADDGRPIRVGTLPGDLAWVAVGTLDGTPAWAVDVTEPESLPGRWRGWRGLAAELPAPQADLAGRALAVITWRRTHRWCGACRAELADVPGETARRCPDCGLTLFLPLTVAVLTAITRPGPAGGAGDLLLVRHTYGPTGLWALVAGFVEAGESLEAAVHRETAEEVGLTLGPPTYVDSQPWAFSGPGTLLVGFTAEVADPTAAPVVDGTELAEARWFPVDALPAELPPAYSLSRWLIDAAVRGGPPRAG